MALCGKGRIPIMDGLALQAIQMDVVAELQRLTLANKAVLVSFTIKTLSPYTWDKQGPKFKGSLKFEQRVDDHVVEKTLGDILDNQEPIETKRKPS